MTGPFTLGDPVPDLTVRQSNTAAFIGLLVRNLGSVIGAVSSILALLSQHDLRGLVEWVRTSDWAGIVGAVLWLSSVAWSIVVLRRRKAKLLQVAVAAPEAVKVVP